MFNFLHRAAATVVLLSVHKPWKNRVRIPRRPSPPRGHLALVGRHPGLRDLSAALASSSDAVFLDAAHALAASAIRAPTITGRLLRASDGAKGVSKNVAAAESGGAPGSDAALQRRIQLALLRAREGRFDEALADLARVVENSPGDPHPRIATAALCYLHGHPRTAHEWLTSFPPDRVVRRWAYEIAVVIAMPGSSPQPPERGIDGNVMCLATRLAESNLLASIDRGEWSMAQKLLVSLILRALRRVVSKYRSSPCAPVKRSTAGGRGRTINGNFMLVECSQAILAAALRARPLCGVRLQEVRSAAERALADAEAKGDTPAAVDVNLVLAFLAARDGNFEEALRRYAAAVRKDPSDSRPYELADALCSICGFTKGRDAWRRSKEKLRPATKPHDGLPVLRDQLVVAAALGHGNLTASDPHCGHISLAARREVDLWLAAAPQHIGLNAFDSLKIRMLRVGLQRWMDNGNHGPKMSTNH